MYEGECANKNQSMVHSCDKDATASLLYRKASTKVSF